MKMVVATRLTMMPANRPLAPVLVVEMTPVAAVVTEASSAIPRVLAMSTASRVWVAAPVSPALTA